MGTGMTLTCQWVLAELKAARDQQGPERGIPRVASSPEAQRQTGTWAFLTHPRIWAPAPRWDLLVQSNLWVMATGNQTSLHERLNQDQTGSPDQAWPLGRVAWDGRKLTLICWPECTPTFVCLGGWVWDSGRVGSVGRPVAGLTLFRSQGLGRNPAPGPELP